MGGMTGTNCILRLTQHQGRRLPAAEPSGTRKCPPEQQLDAQATLSTRPPQGNLPCMMHTHDAMSPNGSTTGKYLGSSSSKTRPLEGMGLLRIMDTD
jgi:hypothetical protein